ncbi:bifunctional DNA primase/polymerase [Pseudogemmobacter bohemicus]|uniref:bifunctional DNA primase/polymerase n=1 Tax=Pseudogemmobacter bohemicus TaxID=2250708 RepID=UPI000DD375B9|nr:bifunctional DNA primase/polymerase [Pseudogemmobacter bohemicus]
MIFASEYRAYKEAGFEPRPVTPGTKGPKVKDWNKPDAELPPDIYEKWAAKYADQGLCLRLGTVLPDGTMLAALDIDDDRFVRAAQFMLGNPRCGRFGSRGMAWFVRIRGEMKKAKIAFDIEASDGSKVHVGELLGKGCALVIPPTIHPGTERPYEWIGEPLLSVGIENLPIIEV